MHDAVVEQRLSLVTLGVTDLVRAQRFYEELGWKAADGSSADVVFFQAGCLVLALWGRDDLARDSVVEDSGGWDGTVLGDRPGRFDRASPRLSPAG